MSETTSATSSRPKIPCQWAEDEYFVIRATERTTDAAAAACLTSGATAIAVTPALFPARPGDRLAS